MTFVLAEDVATGIEHLLRHVGRGFEIVDPGVERAGSIEWALARRSSTLAEALVVAVTPAGNTEHPLVEVQLSAGADDGDRFRREVVYRDVVDDLDPVLAILPARVDAALSWLALLGPEDLLIPHLVPQQRRALLENSAAAAGTVLAGRGGDEAPRTAPPAAPEGGVVQRVKAKKAPRKSAAKRA